MRVLAPALALVVLLAGCGDKTTPRSTPDTFGDECRPSQYETYVFGKVTDTSKATLAQANVTASALGHIHKIYAETDTRGCYAFDMPPSQYHDITATKDGYASKTAKSVEVERGDGRKVNFELGRA